MRFGIQIHPLPTAPDTVVYAKRRVSQYPSEKLWVTDPLADAHALISLAAIVTQTQAHVGTSVTHPFCRTPVDLASGFAALSHLAQRGITVGIGAGSSTSDMIRKPGRVRMLREMILF